MAKKKYKRTQRSTKHTYKTKCEKRTFVDMKRQTRGPNKYNNLWGQSNHWA